MVVFKISLAFVPCRFKKSASRPGIQIVLKIIDSGILQRIFKINEKPMDFLSFHRAVEIRLYSIEFD